MTEAVAEVVFVLREATSVDVSGGENLDHPRLHDKDAHEFLQPIINLIESETDSSMMV